MNEMLKKMRELSIHYEALISPDTYAALIHAQTEKLKEMFADIVKDQVRFNESIDKVAESMIEAHNKKVK